MNYNITMKSGNAKIGPIPVSMTARASCPSACPFIGNGCYAENWPLRLHWDNVSEGRTGMTFGAFLAAVSSIPDGQLWRHNQAGDLPGEGNKIDRRALRQLVKANGASRGFTYTHKPMTAANLAAVREANAAGFTVNLSANTLAHADTLAETGAGPVVVVLATQHGARGADVFTPAGRRVVTCPATYKDEVSCASCQLCAHRRYVIVGFPAHGSTAKKAARVAAS